MSTLNTKVITIIVWSIQERVDIYIIDLIKANTKKKKKNNYR